MMGIEIPDEYGGTAMSFTQCRNASVPGLLAWMMESFAATAAIIAIQELAKVDPAIAVIVDIQVSALQLASPRTACARNHCDWRFLQNTLINKAFMTFASQPLKEKYLPRLATGHRCGAWGHGTRSPMHTCLLQTRWLPSVSRSQDAALMRLP